MTARLTCSPQGSPAPRKAPHKAHLPREVTLLIEVYELVFLAVHPQPNLERVSASVKAELELTQTVEEFGQVAAHLGGGTLALLVALGSFGCF